MTVHEAGNEISSFSPPPRASHKCLSALSQILVMIMHLQSIFLPRFKLNYSIVLKTTDPKHKFNTAHNAAICHPFFTLSCKPNPINLKPKWAPAGEGALRSTRFRIHVPSTENVTPGPLALAGPMASPLLYSVPPAATFRTPSSVTWHPAACFQHPLEWKTSRFLNVWSFTLPSHLYDG